MKQTKQKGGFPSMLLGTLGASQLGNMLAGKRVVRAGEGIIRAGYGSNRSSFKKKLIPPHPLTNFEIQNYYKNETRFNGAYSRDNLPGKIKDGAHVINHDNKIKDGAYVISLDDYSDIGTHWTALYVNAETVTCFDGFGVESIQKEVKKCIKRSIDKFTIVTNNFRIQAYDSQMRGYFCIRLIDFMLKGKILTDFTNLFSPNDFKKIMI